MDEEKDEGKENLDDDSKNDSLEDVLIEGLEKDESEDIDLGESEKDLKEEISEKEETGETEELEALKQRLKDLETDKKDLNKALHQARQKTKAIKKEGESPLSDAQLLKILEDNEDDPQTILNVVRYAAEQAAKKETGEAIISADLKAKQKEAEKTLYEMYPSLSDESSDIRKAVDETKSYYGLDGNALGDFFATGVQVLNALPGLLESAEKRGRELGLKSKTDVKRKEGIKDNLSLSKRKEKSFAGGLSTTQFETAKQLGLDEAQMKTYQKLVGKTGTVMVKE